MATQQIEINRSTWEIPPHECKIYKPRSTRYCLVIPVYNEGERICSVLKKLKIYTDRIDVCVLDKGSTDGSLDEAFLKDIGVRALLIKNDAGKLSAQLRMGYAFILEEGYEGVITIDGNDKDDVDALPLFIARLDQGYDFVQASRYVKGGSGVNTPLIRDMAIRLIHAPAISHLAGFHYTDTTQGYRGYSRRFLLDEKVAPFRKIFSQYELLAYLSVQAPRRGYRVIEVPVTRTYPKGKKIPTKISFVRGNVDLLAVLFKLWRNKYDTHA